MNTKSLTLTWRHILALALVVTTTGAVAARADDHRAGIVGVWAVQVTLRNCATQDPLGPAFNSLVTFHGDGSVSEGAASLAFAPGQRTAGHGTWSRSGMRSFKQEMINLLVFDTAANPPLSPGFFAGWQTVTHDLTLIDASHMTSSGTNAFFRLDGTQYRTGCSTATGQRFD